MRGSILVGSEQSSAASRSSTQSVGTQHLTKAQIIERKEAEFLKLVEQFGQDAENLKQQQRRVDMRKTRLEDRMIGILSFTTTIELYKRFLDERYINANQVLTMPAESLVSMENYIEKLESYIKQIGENAGNLTTSDLEFTISREELDVETMEAQNTARSALLQLRKAQQIKPQAQIPIILERKLDSDEEPPVFDFNDVYIDEEMFTRLKKRQVNFDDSISKLEESETTSNNKTRASQLKYRAKTRQIKDLRNRLIENEKIRLDISDEIVQISDLRQTLCEVQDELGKAKRNKDFLSLLEKLNQADAKDLASYKAKIEERKLYSRKRKHQYKKHKAAVDDYKAEVDKAQEEYDAYEASVIELENQIHEAEMNINSVLKHTQYQYAELNENSIIETDTSHISKLDELQKMVSLVFNGNEEEY